MSDHPTSSPRPRTSRSVKQTESIAAALAELLHPGDVVALYGDLGAGKTQFVRGLVKACGGDGHAVSSPTFVLLHIYPTPKWTIYHLDAYRVHGAEDFEAIGFTELLDQGGIVMVEWPSRIESLLPPGRIDVQLEITGRRTRRITAVRRGSSPQ